MRAGEIVIVSDVRNRAVHVAIQLRLAVTVSVRPEIEAICFAAVIDLQLMIEAAGQGVPEITRSVQSEPDLAVRPDFQVLDLATVVIPAAEQRGRLSLAGAFIDVGKPRRSVDKADVEDP